MVCWVSESFGDFEFCLAFPAQHCSFGLIYPYMSSTSWASFVNRTVCMVRNNFLPDLTSPWRFVFIRFSGFYPIVKFNSRLVSTVWTHSPTWSEFVFRFHSFTLRTVKHNYLTTHNLIPWRFAPLLPSERVLETVIRALQLLHTQNLASGSTATDLPHLLHRLGTKRQHQIF